MNKENAMKEIVELCYKINDTPFPPENDEEKTNWERLLFNLNLLLIHYELA